MANKKNAPENAPESESKRTRSAPGEGEATNRPMKIERLIDSTLTALADENVLKAYTDAAEARRLADGLMAKTRRAVYVHFCATKLQPAVDTAAKAAGLIK